jgi:hypothetical protein
MQFYTDPDHAPVHALPNAQTFEVREGDDTGDLELEPGWYWWFCFPGCLSDGEPVGPFETERAAIADAQDND